MNLTEVADQVMEAVIRGEPADLHFTADSLELEWGLEDSWMTFSNWKRVTRNYLNPSWVEAFLTGDIDYLPSMDGHERDLNGPGAAHSWGACIIGWNIDEAGCLHMHSRTSIAGFMVPLDLAIGARLATLAGVDRLAFHLDYAQVHRFKSMPWFLARGGIDRAPASMLWRYNRLIEMDKKGVRYADMKYGQECRFRRRFHTEYYGPGYGRAFEGGSPNTRLHAGWTEAAPLPVHRAADLDFSHLGIE